MNIFFDVAQQLILPSVFIPLIIGFGILLTFRSKSFKIGRIIALFGLGVYYLFSITPVSDLLLYPLERNFVPLENIERAEKIVLLLGGRESDILRGSEVLRIAHLRNHQATIIISGIDYTNPRGEEAPAVRNFFISRGVPAENIVIEGSSRNTWENVRNVVKIIEDEPFFLVTSAYHMERAISEFKKVGANPIPAPTDFRRKGQHTFLGYFPNARNLRNSDLAIHEHFGKLFYYFLPYE